MPTESERIVVGSIEEYEVIYVPQKDLYFCKNTVIPRQIILKFLDSNKDRMIVKNLTLSKDKNRVVLGCLKTNKQNINQILDKTLWQIKNKQTNHQ